LTGLSAVAATADWIWFCFLRHFCFFSLRMFMFWRKISWSQVQFLFFGQASSFDMKYKSSVARSVFLFSAFSIYSVFRREQFFGWFCRQCSGSTEETKSIKTQKT